jgi:hypothetical protein
LGAVFESKSSGAAAPHVFVRSGEVWERREVQLGLASNTAVSVRSGLQPGDVVAAELPPSEIKKEQG